MMAMKVGITGGIGSGKTMVCRVFSKLGVPVFKSDEVARELMCRNDKVREQLICLFGKDIYLKNGDIDRNKLANIIFNDKIALKNVNQVVHPEVRKRFIEWSAKQNAAYLVQESAILFENKLTEFYDKIIVVTAADQLRIDRAMKRDNHTRKQVLEKMKNQLPQEEKVRRADFVVDNNEDRLVIPQVLEIDEKIRKEWQSLVNG